MSDDLITLSGHTEGPWRTVEFVPLCDAIKDWSKDHANGLSVDASAHCVALINRNMRTLSEANARLIAAAPSLLAIATGLSEYVRYIGDFDDADFVNQLWKSRGIAPPASADAVGRDGE